MKKPPTLLPPVHLPQWVNRRCRIVAGNLGMRCQVWFKQGGSRYLVLNSRPSTFVGRRRVYLSAGIHGDEAGSVLGLIRWLEQAKKWAKAFHFTIFPCLNPWGLQMNSRLDVEHRDLNRCYGQDDVPSIVAHRKAIQQASPFDLALMLHEDYDAQGMYLYEVTNEPRPWGHDLLSAASEAVPADPRAKIEGRAANRGVVKRNLRSKSWQARFEKWGYPEAVHMYMHYCPRVYTLETPSEFGLEQRARAHVLAINRALELLAGRK